MASITQALQQIKTDLENVLPEEHIAQVCREIGHTWRRRMLDPIVTVHIFILQVLHSNTAAPVPPADSVTHPVAVYRSADEQGVLRASDWRFTRGEGDWGSPRGGELGRHSAGDASGLSARKDRSKKRPTSADRNADELPQPAGGRKEYTDAEGCVTHVVEWFGYKFYLLVDVEHEVILAWRISSTKTGDNEVSPELLEQTQANVPAGRIETLAYDKAADTA